MVGAQGAASFRPGTVLVVDREAVILPGHFVLADLPDLDEPLFRQYKAARPYQERTPFTLVALNPAYDSIDITSRTPCTIIGRVIWTASPL